MNKKNNVGVGPMSAQKGITLIALVITIIVMLILVGVTISMAVNGGLFDYAGKAVGETQNTLNAEQQLANGGITIGGKYYNSIDEYLKGDTGKVTGTYANAKKDANGMLTANATYTQRGYTATIPKGFKVSDVAAEQTITEGLVIEDKEGNQFVWIPVKNGEFERTEWFENMPGEEYIEQMNLDSCTEDELFTKLATFYATNEEWDGYSTLEEALVGYGIIEDETESYTIEDLKTYFNDTGYSSVETAEDIKEEIIRIYTFSDVYIESSTNDPTGEYDNMVASVQTYGGFYIGRFEAGSNENRTTTRTDETVLVQKGAYPYYYVMWGSTMEDYETERTNYGHGAVYLSKNMYTGEEYGVTSTLCYGVQWDATLRFIRDKVDVTNSTQWGNYRDHEFTFTGKYSTDSGKTWTDATSETKPKESSWLLTTGASETNKAKNIYDLAGNVDEWTMEAYSSSIRVCRDGSYYFNRSHGPATYRYGHSPIFTHDIVGFRPALYIK